MGVNMTTSLRQKISDFDERIEQYIEENKEKLGQIGMAIFGWVYSAAIIYISLRIALTMLGYETAFPELLEGIFSIALGGVLSVVSVYGLISHQVSIWIQRAIPLIVILLALGVSLQFMINLSSVLIGYLNTIQIDYPDALIVTIGVSYVTSLLVLVNTLYSRPNKISSSANWELNLHTVVCIKAGLEPSALLTELRQRHSVSGQGTPTSNISKTEIHFEIRASLSVAIIALIIYWRILNLAGSLPDEEFQSFLLIPGLILLWAIYGFITGAYNHRTWRHYWLEYWNFVRRRVLPRERILDELPPLGFSLVAMLAQEEGYEEYQVEAEKLALLHKLKFEKKDNWFHMEYINWYHRTKHKLSRIKEEHLDRIPILKEFKTTFENLKDEFPAEDFPNLVRGSFALDASRVYTRTPDVFNTIAKLASWEGSEPKNNYQAEILSISSEQLGELEGLPPVPLSKSVKWLFAIFMLALTIIPYFLAFGFVMIIP
jgi:hypothetical protein